MIKYVLTIMTMVLMVSGCSGSKKPEGMPDLVPCTITLTQQGNPAADVMVSFLAVQNNQTGGFSIRGTTDAQGKLSVKTQEKFAGIPSGEYTLILEKTEVTGSGSNALPGSQTKDIRKIYSLVEKKYRNKKTSPLKLTVDQQPVDQTFDIGKAVRIELTGKDFDIR